MKTLNKKATEIMATLTQLCDDGNGYVKIDNAKGAFMSVVVEKIDETDKGPLYSVAHYYTQNGDAMRDPEMTFLRMYGQFVPCYYLQDNLGIEQNSVFRNEDGRWKINKRLQEQHASFANLWMKNIKQQQRL